MLRGRKEERASDREIKQRGRGEVRAVSVEWKSHWEKMKERSGEKDRKKGRKSERRRDWERKLKEKKIDSVKNKESWEKIIEGETKMWYSIIYCTIQNAGRKFKGTEGK